MTPHTAAPDRQYFLDWLRILAFATLVLYHVGMYYVSWDFHVKSPFAGPGLEPWMKLSEPWRMSLLFLISGAATAYMLKSGPSLVLVRRRSTHLLLPLLCGVVLIVPPQSYYQVVQQFHYTGNYLEFLRLYFTHYPGFCSNGQCLLLPTWNHLWFLPYLWVYTLLASGLLALWPAALQMATRCATVVLRGVGLVLTPIALIFLARMSLFDAYPATHALGGDWFNHALYFGMFLMGAVCATAAPMWNRFARWRWPALLMALAFWASLVFAQPSPRYEHAIVAIYQWNALVAALGFARVHLNRDAPLRSTLTEAVFPVYLLHQTILIVGSQVLLPLQLHPALEGPLLIVLTFSLSYAGYALVRRIRYLQPWFGLRTATC